MIDIPSGWEKGETVEVRQIPDGRWVVSLGFNPTKKLHPDDVAEVFFYKSKELIKWLKWWYQ